MNKTLLNKSAFVRSTAGVFVASCLVFVLFFGFALPLPFGYESRTLPSRFSLVTPVSAGNTYYNFSTGNLSLTLHADPASADLIAVNNDWSSIPHVEGYRGDDLAPEGTDPQTVTSTETGINFPLPLTASTYIQANKGNTSAVNNGGLAEFDRAPDVNNICYGFQGNVQADNPYMVFYINTTGRYGINMSYRVRDVDAGNNSSVSAIALQYRLGESGPFINVPAGYIADATDGPNISGRTTTRSVALPAAVNNQPQVQVRLITSNAAGPDEWIGVNNIVLGPFGPTAAGASVGGRIYSPHGRPLANARVLMYDGSGSTRAAISNAFGYYRFEGVPVGQTYIFEVRSRRYAFSEAIRTLSVQEDFDSLDFYADSASLLDTTPGVLDGKR